MNRLICLSAMLGCASWASAQAPEAVSEKDFLGEMPMVLSVSRLPQRLDETPGAVTILDRDMIRLSGARDVADLLRLVPGFQTSTSFETTAPLASYHGGFDGYSNHIQVLIDGRSAYSPYFIGSIGPGLQTVALTDIERIEVLRGSNSAAYGARAMLGVVNIVTRHTQDTLGLQAGVTRGENGIRDAQARLGWGSDAASFRLSVDQRADRGLAGSNGHNEINRINLRADLRTSANDEVQLRVGGLAMDSGKGKVGNVNDPLRDSYFGSTYAQLDWRRSLGVDEDVALSLSHSEETYRDDFPYSLLPFGINDRINIEASGRASSDSVSLQHTFRHGPALRVVWGGELRNEQVISKPIYNTESPFMTEFTRLFGNAEWRIARDWILNAGAMFEKTSVSGESFAPRVMLNWHAAEGQTLRAGISRAYRPPSTFEKYSDIRYFWQGRLLGVTLKSSGKVEPESLLAREIGYLGEFPGVRMSLDVRAFHEYTDGFIRQNTSVSPKDYKNTEGFSIQGLEYELKWRPWRDAQFIFNQTYTDINSPDLGAALAAPKLASSLTYFQKLPGGLDLSLMHQDSGTVTLQGASYKDQVAMTRTDLRLGLPLRWGRHRGEVALVVQNLGMPYADFSPNFQFERRAFVTLRVEN
jgi:iron complex outermembrane receptor protein